jgi:hypothetical protein
MSSTAPHPVIIKLKDIIKLQSRPTKGKKINFPCQKAKANSHFSAKGKPSMAWCTQCAESGLWKQPYNVYSECEMFVKSHIRPFQDNRENL